eukprot:2217947-Pleurochrysis_carterae.AAC.10
MCVQSTKPCRRARAAPPRARPSGVCNKRKHVGPLDWLAPPHARSAARALVRRVHKCASDRLNCAAASADISALASAVRPID